MKDREVDQKNKASGYETLLRDGIPLNEHFLALKNKFNNEQDMKKKEIEMMEEKIRHEESMNKSKLHKINIGKNEYLEQSTKNQDYIEATVKQMKDLETKLFTENHTRDNLTIEKKKLVDVNNSLKGENQTMGRQITQDKYHNKTGDEEKKRRVYLEKVTDDYLKMTKKIEEDQALLEQEIERNEDPNLLKNQKAYTTELQNDHQ